MSRLALRRVVSPVGVLRLTASDDALTGLHFVADETDPTPATEGAHPVLDLAARELAEYFAGERRTFTIPLAHAGTPFQREVWQALTAIPHGQTRSYADIARAIGRPRAVRAVGAANHDNPVAIVVPCHRVLGANGALTGYAGGLATKRWLLVHERALLV